ncbi:MAG TPA: hypothetical protein VGF85_06710 [Opitutaceae bacterium]|jgi:hypothetical protein
MDDCSAHHESQVCYETEEDGAGETEFGLGFIESRSSSTRWRPGPTATILITPASTPFAAGLRMLGCVIAAVGLAVASSGAGWAPTDNRFSSILKIRPSSIPFLQVLTPHN